MFLLYNLKALRYKIRWGDVADRLKSILVLLYEAETTQGSRIIIDYKPSSKVDVGMLILEGDLPPERAAFPESLMETLRYYRAESGLYRKIAIIMDGDLLGKCYMYPKDGKSLVIESHGEEICVSSSNKTNETICMRRTDIKITDVVKDCRQVGLNDLNLLEDRIVARINEGLKRTLNPVVGNNKKKGSKGNGEAPSKKKPIGNTGLWFNEDAVYTKDSTEIFKCHTAKYIILTSLAKEVGATNKLTNEDLVEKLGEDFHYKKESIVKVISEINQIVSKTTKGECRRIIKNLPKNKYNNNPGYYIDSN